MAKPKAVDITVILDRSGSMESVRDDTIGGFNAFLAQQKELPGECSLTMYQFESGYYNTPMIDMVIDHKPIAEVPPLTRNTFVPGGGTPLFDAIGQACDGTITRLGKRATKAITPIVVIITDGQENTSRKFTRADIKAKISELTEAGWQFVYIGANQDAFAEGGSLGVNRQSTITWTNNDIGTHALYNTVSVAVAGVRGGNEALAFNAADYAAQEAAKA